MSVISEALIWSLIMVILLLFWQVIIIEAFCESKSYMFVIIVMVGEVCQVLHGVKFYLFYVIKWSCLSNGVIKSKWRYMCHIVNLPIFGVPFELELLYYKTNWVRIYHNAVICLFWLKLKHWYPYEWCHSFLSLAFMLFRKLAYEGIVSLLW